MAGPNGVGERRTVDWQQYFKEPAEAEAKQRNVLPPETAPWAKDFENLASPKTSIGLVIVDKAGQVAFTPSAATTATSATQREAAAERARLAAVVHPERRFSDLKPLSVEIFRLKSELRKQHGPEVMQAARQQLCMLQSQWVALAKTANIPEPTGRLDPLTAKPQDIARAFMWSEAGGTVPRNELEADGGTAFKRSIHEAVTLKMQGFDALLDLHRNAPAIQKDLLRRELARLGDASGHRSDDTVESMSGRRRDIVMKQDAAEAQKEADAARRQLYIGLDGFVGTAESVTLYERSEALNAMNPGTTVGSILATCFGDGDVTKMRNLGAAGNAVEGIAGGAGVVIKKIQDAREPPGRVIKQAPKANGTTASSGVSKGPTVLPAPTTAPRSAAAAKVPLVNDAPPGAKPSQNVGVKSAAAERIDQFNSRGTFRTKEMNARYRPDPATGKLGEHEPGNKIWTQGKTVQYCMTAVERAPYKLEVREIEINGVKESRLFDAQGNLFDTRTAQTWSGDARAIFVMNSAGEIFASPYQEAGKFHHSSLAGGQPVAAAGELTVIDGKLTAISNRSGHYMPDSSFTDQAIASLRSRGIEMSGVRVIDERTQRETILF